MADTTKKEEQAAATVTNEETMTSTTAADGNGDNTDNTTNNDNDDDPQKPRREDLIELIRAIKFAKPDASQSQVHKEITEELSQKSSEFAFLKHVHKNDVKKVWKKAMMNGTNNNNNNSTPNQDLKEQLQATGQPVQVFTVGNASVQHLAQEYTAAHVAAQQQLLAAEEKSRLEDYVYVFLNVPADKSGSRPHQALIHFPKAMEGGTAANTTTTSTTTPTAKAGGNNNNKKKGNNKKKKGKASTDTAAASSSATIIDDKIVKIQMAASDDDDDTKYPMLVYNHSRSAKTFVHPTDEGYDRIRDWICNKGVGGTLGAKGGSKAYFYGNVLSYKGGEDILQIQVSELAPNQEW